MSEERMKMAVSAALDMTKQLITLATGIITVFVAIVGLLKPVTRLLVQYLMVALFLELMSIVLGLLVQGAIISALSEKPTGVVYEGMVTTLGKLQWLFFLLGILSLALSLSALA